MLSAAAITRLSLSGLLALAPWAVGAQVASQIGAARAAALADQATDLPDDAAGLPPMPMGAGAGAMMPTPRNVKKLSDGELSCAQIYAETQVLEKTSQERGAEAEQAQAAMMASQNEMMKQASGMGGGMGSSVGGSLLSLIPGGGQIQSFAMQAAADARRASMQDSVEKMMQVQTRLVNAEQARELAQARSEHLTDLFLKKGCKLSEVKSAGAAP